MPVVHSDTLWLGLFVIVFSSTDNPSTVVFASQCKQTNAVFGYRLQNHVVRQSFESESFECVMRCKEKCYCHSMNYRTTDKLCELNNASKTSHSKDYVPKEASIYMEFESSKTLYKSCMDVKTTNASAQSGYYNLLVQERCLVAYCDMTNYDGGWTLVVSISNQNNNHLLSSEHNCLNSSLCIPHDGTTQSRKLADHEIHQLAASEGTYRVQVLPAASSAYDIFYQIPSGPENFNSSCRTSPESTCPRIIISKSPYPYAWESNCRGTSVGYRLSQSDCHRVFDGHSDDECGSEWQSSAYLAGTRVLYGYPCPSIPEHDSKGIYLNNKGMLFVR